MTTETPTPEISTEPSLSAGALLRQYRQEHGLQVDALAATLRVSASKLEALEADRLDQLPDAMFARALALAVCRHLKTDPAPVLATLPLPDASRLAPKNELGLNFPLDRPSFLPQSSFLVIQRLFTPVRWVALAIFVVALLLGLWPEIQPLLVFKNEPALAVTPVPVAGTATRPEEAEQKPDLTSANMVVTTVHSPALVSQLPSQSPSQAATQATSQAAPASGGADAR
jgi:cytoskeleton protein RodZ